LLAIAGQEFNTLDAINKKTIDQENVKVNYEIFKLSYILVGGHE
jgi:RNA-binding protein YlmH